MTKEIIPQPEGALAIPKTRDEALERVMSNYPVLDPDDVELRSAMEVMTATTPEDTLRAPESVSLRDIGGEPFWLEGITGLLPSTMEESAGKYYALYRCAWDDGRKFTATSGSPYVFFRAARCDEMGWLPRRMVSLLVQSKTNVNRWSLWVVDRPLRAEPDPIVYVEADAVVVPS
jgi:hypothetical protein